MPAVWNELRRHQHELTDENAVQLLLNTLHNPDALPIKAKALYRAINEHIQAHPALIWPMLARSKHWHQTMPAEVRVLFYLLTGKDVDESCFFFPLLHTDYGKNITLGEMYS
jgi:hypothetical protein